MSNSIGFQLFKITTDEFATNSIDLDENKEVEISVGINFGISTPTKGIACFVQFKFEQEDIPIILLKLKCEFLIEEKAWDEFLYKSKKRIKFPKKFIQHLVVITVGTARGIIHSKTENTSYNQIILPTVNVSNMVKEDEVFNI